MRLQSTAQKMKRYLPLPFSAGRLLFEVGMYRWLFVNLRILFLLVQWEDLIAAFHPSPANIFTFVLSFILSGTYCSVYYSAIISSHSHGLFRNRKPFDWLCTIFKYFPCGDIPGWLRPNILPAWLGEFKILRTLLHSATAGCVFDSQQTDLVEISLRISLSLSFLVHLWFVLSSTGSTTCRCTYAHLWVFRLNQSRCLVDQPNRRGAHFTHGVL